MFFPLARKIHGERGTRPGKDSTETRLEASFQLMPSQCLMGQAVAFTTS